MNTHKTAFKILTTMNETLDLDAYTAINIMPYGVAMLLSLIGGDGERNRLFTNLYNAKRGAVLNRVDAVTDAMPKVDGGAI